MSYRNLRTGADDHPLRGIMPGHANPVVRHAIESLVTISAVAMISPML